MTANACTEKALVEQSAMELLGALDWATASARDEVFGASGTFGRETAREVTLKQAEPPSPTAITPPSRVAPVAGIDSCRVPLE